MAGHVEDRWWRDKTDENGNVVLNGKGKPVQEKTELYGKGLRYRVRYYVDKKERSKSFPDKQKKRAEDFLLSVQTDALTGTRMDPDAGKMRLRSYVASYLKGQSEDPSTQRTYRSKLENMVFPFFGDPFLAGMTNRDNMRDWLDWMKTKGDSGRTLSASYRGQVFDLLSAILSAALDDGKIGENPLKAKSIKRPKAEERKTKPWPEEKLRKVQEGLPEPYQIVVPIGGGLGLRQMEILAFSPDDIDRTKMEMEVLRQIKWFDGVPVFGLPKGGKTRVVSVGEGVLQDIDEYMENHEPVTVTLPWERPDGDPVTVNLLIDKARDGMKRTPANDYTARIWQGQTFQSGVWQPAFGRAGLTYVNQWDGMHALRHFYASLMLAQGVSIKELSEYLGHHDPGFTLRKYTHLMPSSHERARLASNQVFKPRPRRKRPRAVKGSSRRPPTA